MLQYRCDNPACPRYDDIVGVAQGADEATCILCGWLMSAVYG